MNKGNKYSQIQNGIVNSIINDKTFIIQKMDLDNFFKLIKLSQVKAITEILMKHYY